MLMPVYVPSLLMAVSQEALLLLLPLYVLELGGGVAFAAFVVGLRGIGVLLFDLPAGMLVARFGDKPVLVGGLVAILLSLIAFAVLAEPRVLAVSALLLGAGHAAWMLGRQSYIADTCPNYEVGRAIAVMAGLHRVGAFIGPAAGGLIATLYGFQTAFAAGAVCAAAAVVLVLVFTVTSKPTALHGHVGLAGTLRVARYHRRALATAGLGCLTLQLMRSTRQVLVPLFGQSLGFDAAAIGLIYSLSAAIDMSLFYPVGVIVDRWGRKWTAGPSMLLFALGLALLPLASGFGSLLSVGLVLGLANGLSTGIVLIIGSDLAQRSIDRGQFLGVWRVLGDTGISGGPLLTGVLAEVASLGAASLVVAGAGLAGAAVMLLLVPETLRKARRPEPEPEQRGRAG
jgi:MFS family permease